MKTSFTDDPVADYAAYDHEQEEKLDSLPRCSRCGEPIQDEYAFEYEGGLYCEDCYDWYIADLIKDGMKTAI